MSLRSVVGRNLLLLSFVSLLNDFSTDMVFPILPSFLALLGGGALAVGTMEGAADSIAAFLRYGSGRLSDRFGQRKSLTFAGYAFSSLVKVFYGAANHVSQVILIRGSDRVGKGMREAPRDAIIAESVPRPHWGFAFGFHRMMDTTGALLGPLTALVLLGLFGSGEASLRRIFFIAAIPGLLGLLLILWVRETGRGPAVLSAPGRIVPRATVRGPLPRFLLVIALFTLGNLSVAFLILRATELGMGLVNVVLLYTWFNGTEAIASLPIGAITDRVGRPPLLATAFALLSITFGGVFVFDPSTWWGLLPFFVLVGIANAARQGNGRAFVADLTSESLRATGFGAYHATIGFLALPSGLLAGWLWGFGHRWTFLMAQFACAMALLLFVYYWSRGALRRAQEDPHEDHGAAHVGKGT